MKAILITVCLLLSDISLRANDQISFDIAKTSLQKNIVQVGNKQYLTAGSNQFKSLWTRDFCFSIEGLLILGEDQVVKDQLELLIKNINQEGLVPLYMDSIHPMIRVGLNSLKRVVKKIPNPKLTKHLKFSYHVLGKYPAIDSNLLVLWGSFQYANKTNDWKWFSTHLESLKKIFHYYQNKTDNYLITQPSYSDWQDSSKRNGKTSYTNVLYLKILKTYKQYFDISDDLFERTHNEFINTFLDQRLGILFSTETKTHHSLDSNLLYDYFKISNKRSFFKDLIQSDLIQTSQIPGRATFPNYPLSDIAFHNKISGTKNYHGEYVWLWLSALYGILALENHELDIYENLKSDLSSILMTQNVVSEVYHPINLRPIKTKLYQSEEPFSWNAAFLLILFSPTVQSSKTIGL